MKELCFMSRHHGYMVYGLPGEFAPIRCNMDKPKKLTDQAAEAYKFLESAMPELSIHAQLYFSGFIDGCTPYDEPPDVVSAINAAKSARFEFGHSGAVT